MRTCPNCGSATEDEVVCSSCGAFIAMGVDDADESTEFMDDLGFSGGAGSGMQEGTQEVKTWRVAAFAITTCILAVATAIVLLHQGSSGKHDVALPLTPSSVPPPSPTASFPAIVPTTGAVPTPSLVRTVAAPSKSAHPTRPATSSATHPPSLSPTRTVTSPPPTVPPPSTSSSVSRQSVTLARGAAAHELLCDRHCFHLVVTLSGFPTGPHEIDCHSEQAGTFDTYTTSATTSTDCVYGQVHDVVWVVVDGQYQSNRVNW